MATTDKPGDKITLAVHNDEDVIVARQKIRELAQDIGFSMLDQTRIVTAASELARNVVVHGKGGAVEVEPLSGPRPGIRMVFRDQGPGIPDLEEAMQEGFSTIGSLGMGLTGAKRLVDQFEIESKPGKGTVVTVVKWLPAM